MARRYNSLHHNLKEGENIVFHREHRSPRNRRIKKLTIMGHFDRRSRRKTKQKDQKTWGQLKFRPRKMWTL